MARPRHSPVPLGLVLVRFVTGALITHRAWHWVTTGDLDGGVLRGTVERSLSSLPVPVAWWGETVLLANPDASALFWRAGALVVGLAFLVGGLVRAAGLLGLVLTLHGLLFGPEEAARFLLLVAACLAACASSGAGLRLGLDALIEDRLPPWLSLRKATRSPFLG